MGVTNGLVETKDISIVRYCIMVGNAQSPSSQSFMKSVLFITILLISLVSPSLSRSPYSSCFRSCHHCKEMYGRNFSGHRCAKTCISREGNFQAVCTDLHSIKNFLDLVSLVDYDWAEATSV